MTELAIDLNFTFSEELKAAFAARLPSKYIIKVTGPGKRDPQLYIRIKYAGIEHIEMQSSIGVIIQEFLEGLQNIAAIIANNRGSLLIGIFYDAKTLAAFSLDVSADCIALMSAMNLSLATTSYLCSD